MKILEVCSAYPPSRGGVERFVREISRGLVGRGHEVTVLTSTRGMPTRSSDKVEADGIRVIRYPEHFHLFEAPLIPAISFRILTLDFDVLHVHGMSPTITDLAVIAGRLKGKPVVVTYHNDAESTLDWKVADMAAAWYARLAVPVLRLANVVVCSTRSYAESSPVLRHLFGRLRVIPLGVEHERFSGRPDLERGENRRTQVLFVGQLKDYKGVDVLIRAIAKLRREGHDVGLQVVGAGPMLQKLKGTAAELELNGGINFLGNVDENALVELYHQCDLFVLPSTSRREAFGLVQLEALAAGKKVVASDIPGVSEVTRITGGFLAAPNNHSALADQILRALKAPHDKKTLQDRARGFSWRKAVDSYEELFGLVAGVKTGGSLRKRVTDPPLSASS